MSVITSTGPEPSTQCELSPINASHPVQALMESFTVLSGCASRGTVGLPQEVHVLNLRTADQGAGQQQREVSVGVESIFFASILGSGDQNSSLVMKAPLPAVFILHVALLSSCLAVLMNILLLKDESGKTLEQRPVP